MSKSKELYDLLKLYDEVKLENGKLRAALEEISKICDFKGFDYMGIRRKELLRIRDITDTALKGLMEK